jgi:hypothetical protein
MAMQSKGSNSGNRSRSRGVMVIALTGLAIVGIVVLLVQWNATRTGEGTGPLESGAAEQVELDAVVGRWLRPDGGYILELAGPDPGEKFKATYLNPRPIRVATTRVTRQGNDIRVYVELLDVGYPGSYYDLIYDSTGDQLVGNYFQAKMNATFDVFFVRADGQ